MIDLSCLQEKWIVSTAKKLKISDYGLVEKTIRAVYLLESLRRFNVEFIFKGGTALLLLQNESKRLSIDIDILIEQYPQDLDQIFNEIVREGLFHKVEQQIRAKRHDLNKYHFKFFYVPLPTTGLKENYVLLDIVVGTNPYPILKSTPIDCTVIFHTGESLSVTTPTVDGLLGDKLTAFAPNTTGIPYGKNTEIIKQLFDIGKLFDLVSDPLQILQTFQTNVELESQYLGRNEITYLEVLDDIWSTAQCICSRGQIGRGDFEALQQGIKAVASFIFSERFYLDVAIITASKAAYLSQLIAANQHNINRYQSPESIKEWTITDQSLNKLNSLKRSNPEAFFYLYQAIQLHSTM